LGSRLGLDTCKYGFLNLYRVLVWVPICVNCTSGFLFVRPLYLRAMIFFMFTKNRVIAKLYGCCMDLIFARSLSLSRFGLSDYATSLLTFLHILEFSATYMWSHLGDLLIAWKAKLDIRTSISSFSVYIVLFWSISKSIFSSRFLLHPLFYFYFKLYFINNIKQYYLQFNIFNFTWNFKSLILYDLRKTV
jgi:hypothetical protein